MTRLNALMAALLLAPTLALAQMASAPFDGRLKKIHETKTISIAYRTDAMPFSFEEANKQPSGYMVDLCRRVVGVIERQIGVAPLQVKWVPVTVQMPPQDAQRAGSGAHPIEFGIERLPTAADNQVWRREEKSTFVVPR